MFICSCLFGTDFKSPVILFNSNMPTQPGLAARPVRSRPAKCWKKLLFDVVG